VDLERRGLAVSGIFFEGFEMRGIRRAGRERGSSLIEMLIAMLVLTIGLVGSMAVVGMAIGGNSRSKKDSTSAALAALILGRISSVPVGGGVATVTVKDCAGNTLTVATTGTGAGSGANLTSAGNIDFTQSFSGVTANYAMKYTVCGITNGIQTVYDVRWNIELLPSGKDEYVVAGAQALDTSGTGGERAPAVTIRTIVGNDGN
jgi:type II secretory pathway pseudopilin PulG